MKLYLLQLSLPIVLRRTLFMSCFIQIQGQPCQGFDTQSLNLQV